MLQLMRSVCREEDGQDLIEYSLLITFIAIATAGLIGMGGSSVQGIMNTSNSQLAAANKLAGG